MTTEAPTASATAAHLAFTAEAIAQTDVQSPGSELAFAWSERAFLLGALAIVACWCAGLGIAVWWLVR